MNEFMSEVKSLPFLLYTGIVYDLFTSSSTHCMYNEIGTLHIINFCCFSTKKKVNLAFS